MVVEAVRFCQNLPFLHWQSFDGVQNSSRFRLAGPLRWHGFNGDWVAFSTTSGALQHLDPLTASVLSLVEESPISACAVSERIAAATETGISDDMVTGVAAILDGLHRNGFLECLDR